MLGAPLSPYSRRVTSVLVSRLILNLKIAATQDYGSDLRGTSYLDHQTKLEDRIVGIAANKPEGLREITFRHDSIELYDIETNNSEY